MKGHESMLKKMEYIKISSKYIPFYVMMYGPMKLVDEHNDISLFLIVSTVVLLFSAFLCVMRTNEVSRKTIERYETSQKALKPHRRY